LRHPTIWLALALGIGACGSATERATVPGPPGSVVLFAPSMTEAACALGYTDRIVAITDYDRWPESVLDRPRIGGALDPDLERLAVLRPDLLVLQGESQVLRDFARGNGIRIADVKMDDDIESILEGILRLDDLLGGESSRRGELLVGRIRAGLDSIARAAGPVRPRTLLVLSRNPHTLRGVFTAGRGTFLEDLLEVAGADDWASDQGEGYFEVPLDVLAADPPDLVIEYGPATSVDAAERRRVWDSLPGAPLEIRTVSFEGLMIPGPRVVETARVLAAAIRPGRGEDALRP
jgi:iron complex transport system substrate-binding protein